VPETMLRKWRGKKIEERVESNKFSIVSDFKKLVERNLPPNAKLVDYIRGFYCVSGFIERDGKFVYFSISDIRHFQPILSNAILVRTAKDSHDYTGGINNFADLAGFEPLVDRLLNIQKYKEEEDGNENPKN